MRGVSDLDNLIGRGKRQKSHCIQSERQDTETDFVQLHLRSPSIVNLWAPPILEKPTRFSSQTSSFQSAVSCAGRSPATLQLLASLRRLGPHCVSGEAGEPSGSPAIH